MNVLFTIVNDLNRVKIADPMQPWYRYFIETAMNFDEAVIPVLLFIILFNIIMPVLATMLDKKSYGKLTSSNEETTVD
jgi:hypothetical protein